MSRPILYIRESADLAPLWRDAAQAALPDFEVCIGRQGLDLARVTTALVWEPSPGFLASLPHLSLVVSVGAGVDHILMSDPDYPRHVPLVRMVDPGLTQSMCDYVAWACLSVLRKARFLAGEQAAGRWKTAPIAAPADTCTLTVLGLGHIGLPVARTLQGLGFQVRGWSRSPKQIANLATTSGPGGMRKAIAAADIVVNLLPNTLDTRHLMNADVFNAMKPGAAVVNAGRGTTVDEDALLTALESGQVGEAYLDVFQVEPLPSDHGFWTHPKVTISPHNAAITHPSSGIRALTRALNEQAAGQPLSNLVDWERGY